MGEQDPLNGWTYEVQYPMSMEKEERGVEREYNNTSIILCVSCMHVY